MQKDTNLSICYCKNNKYYFCNEKRDENQCIEKSLVTYTIMINSTTYIFGVHKRGGDVWDDVERRM